MKISGRRKCQSFGIDANTEAAANQAELRLYVGGLEGPFHR